MNNKVIPFLKWAGGKRWLISSRPSLFPKSFNRYIEPFLGSGAVFFHIQPKKAFLADANAELIETYQAIRDDWQRVEQELRRHQKNHNKAYYYKIREAQFRAPYTRAAKLIYLNRTCWNGLYRVNLKGYFNVPIGTKKEVVYETDNFYAISRLLRDVALVHSDFESVIERATAGDFVFVDPPYTVKHNKNNFIKYNEQIFSWEDQLRLRECLIKAASRGAYIVLTNANNFSIRKLYRDHFNLEVVKRNSVIAADPMRRGQYEELLIRSKS